MADADTGQEAAAICMLSSNPEPEPEPSAPSISRGGRSGNLTLVQLRSKRARAATSVLVSSTQHIMTLVRSSAAPAHSDSSHRWRNPFISFEACRVIHTFTRAFTAIMIHSVRVYSCVYINRIPRHCRIATPPSFDAHSQCPCLLACAYE